MCVSSNKCVLFLGLTVLRYTVPALALALLLASILSFPNYAFAAAAKNKAIAASSTAAAATAAEAAKSAPPFMKIINKLGKIAQKIIYGVNSNAATRMLKKAGDTRAEISGRFMCIYNLEALYVCMCVCMYVCAEFYCMCRFDQCCDHGDHIGRMGGGG